MENGTSQQMGWLMQKSQSIWGAVLFHAGMDISVMVGMSSRQPAS